MRRFIMRERFQRLVEWLMPPRRPMEVSEILEAHRAAWRRIEMRRQEFVPPDLQVAGRIVSGLGKTSQTYHGYEDVRNHLGWARQRA